MKRILATIDFDGVVSPINHDYDFSADDSFVEYRLGGFDCFVRKSTVEFLNWLNTQSGIDPVWATSWEDMTAHFAADTNNDFPHFRFLGLPSSKAESILEEAIRVEADEVHIFEDHAKVINKVRSLMRGNREKYAFKLVSHKCETTEGLTEKKILSAKTLLSC